MTNTFTPAYVIARGIHKTDRAGSYRPWEELSLFERNAYVEAVHNVFRVMQELGYAVPDPKDKRK